MIVRIIYAKMAHSPYFDALTSARDRPELGHGRSEIVDHAANVDPAKAKYPICALQSGRQLRSSGRLPLSGFRSPAWRHAAMSPQRVVPISMINDLRTCF